MSLDVYLKQRREEVPESAKAVSLLRANGFDEFATEIEARHDVSEYDYLYDANITHNLNTMADAAGIYKHLWRPDELGITHARQLIEPLRAGWERLRREPERFKQFNPANGWGHYDGLVRFVRAYLSACEEHPNAEVSVSR